MVESDLGLVKGVDGVSPSIVPNAENTDEIYRLDIQTADRTFTTPNLKGEDAKTGGLVFGQDAEGNWGYLPPGADTVVPFKQGGGSGGGGTFGIEFDGYGKISMIDMFEVVILGDIEKGTLNITSE